MSSVQQNRSGHCAAPAGANPPVHGAPGKGTYSEILRSTALIGGSSAANVAIGIVRTKVMAVLLGPAGFGLMGILLLIADLTRSIAEIGINSSGVRQIAQAVGTGDQRRIARTAIVLRRTALLLAFVGAVLLIVANRPIAVLTFGSDGHAPAVAVLSLAVFFRLIADGQGALLQGMRRIREIAKIAVLGSVYGTLLGIPVVYWLREDGVAWALVAVAFASAATTWWYCRRERIEHPTVTFPQLREELRGLIGLGLAFMASGLLMTGAAYVVRIILIRHGGLDAAGFYQAAWTLGGLYVGFVLQAMGADFYPRLVGVANDDREVTRIVNEQAHVSILLAGAGVIGTLAFAPLILGVFYSAQFSEAADTLRWICLGMMLRVISWPVGYVIIAKGAKAVFFLTELAWTIANVGLSWLFVIRWGVVGAGIAFFLSYVLHAVLVYLIVRRMAGFRWSPAVVRSGIAVLCLAAVVFGSFYVLSEPWAFASGAAAMALAFVYSMHLLLKLVPLQRLPRRLHAIVIRVRGRAASMPGAFRQ